MDPDPCEQCGCRLECHGTCESDMVAITPKPVEAKSAELSKLVWGIPSTNILRMIDSFYESGED